uniref:Myosin 5 [Tribolium castaneum] n=1 Tax=Lepeophtheirus salmonis TaxID=72036 RepID=A0A0K2VG83_LEPSM
MPNVNLYSKGARIWLKDPETVWKAASVTQDYDGKVLHVEITDTLETESINISKESDLPPLRNPDILIGENDLTNLSYLHEPAVLHNLAIRFIDNCAIYTYCGIVLVAINPYSDLQIYGNDTISMYRGKNMGDLDPHIYAVAEEAFTRMERDSLNQSIIVSGESGAGKTVSAKYAMRYFATVGGTSQTETQVEKRVLASSPIMEAIGNAKTTRNDNSSRFGKYIEIDFNKQFHIIAADMRTYLLEKSRVVFQAEDERNYHIFYQMCAAREDEFMSCLSLEHPDDFFYLNQGSSPEIDGVDDLKEFMNTREAFHLLGIPEEDQFRIFQILAGILYLGNISVEPSSGRADSESSQITSDESVIKKMSDLLGIEEPQIKKWLVNRKIITSRESYVKPMNAESALFARDALAKTIYSKLFDWIVVKINMSLKTSGKTHKFIGVLDIYGFETFAINSFEQFCINYANEKLQQQFNLHVFKLEQEEYLREGIEWKMIDFYDNQPCIDLIESKLGILDLLDEECRMPKGTDKSWVEKLYDKCKKWQHFTKNRLSQSAFIVQHFADNVEYESQGFLDKNRDTVMEEQVAVIKASSNTLLCELFSEKSLSSGQKTKITPNPTGTLKKNSKKTVGSQFRDSLNLLMDALNSTTPHYVRCIKPNDAKAAFQFDPRRGVQQLRACGVLETVRISAAGYPSRWTYYDFFVRYRVLCRSKDVKKNDFRTTCAKIVEKFIGDEDKYRFGKSKLFFRAGQVAYMEKLRSEKLMACGIMIQKHVKGWLARKKYIRLLTATRLLQRLSRGFIARRRIFHMRRLQAAVKIQAFIRGCLRRKSFNRTKELTIGLQARIRGYNARKNHIEFLKEKKAILIQKHVRGFLQRSKYLKNRNQVILVQSIVRRWSARRHYKKLKIEAKSVEHQKKLNQGLENKIISLQQKLTTSEKENKELHSALNGHTALKKDLEDYKKVSTEAKALQQRNSSLEAQLDSLKQELDSEKTEKIDIINDRVNDSEAWLAKEKDYLLQISSQEEEIRIIKETSKMEGEANTSDIISKLQQEKLSMSQEYEQERIAYQRLVNEYNKLEALYENVQDELNSSGRRTSLVSLTTNEGEDIDSSYGSQSGRSSMRSTHDQLHKSEGSDGDGGQGHVNNVGLTVKLQQKLQETIKERDRLSRRVEELEALQKSNDEIQSNQVLRIQDLEHENTSTLGELKVLRHGILNNNGDNAQLKEVLEQFDSLQEELNRRREECIQLRSLLAANEQPLSIVSKASDVLPDSDDLLAAFESQKKFIKQLQDQIYDEKSRSKEMKHEYEDEIKKLNLTTTEQQQIINETINGSPTNQIEACLQHEITRLTGENFDLREKIEDQTDTNRRLKGQLKTYVKRLRECGASISETNGIEPDINKELPLAMPVIRKKEHDYLGMFEYKKEHEQTIMKALIYDLKPKIASQMLPGLPAYVIFMMIRYTDHNNNDELVRNLIQGCICFIKKVIKKKGQNDIEIQTLWLANILRILHNLQQYSGERKFQEDSSSKQIEQCLRNFDLTEYRRLISDIAIWVYQGVIKLIEEEIQPLIVPAILENDSLGSIDQPRGPRFKPGSKTNERETPIDVEPKEALTQLIELLTRFQKILAKYGLGPEIISMIFRQIFYTICAGSLNNLLLRKDICHWSRGMKIRFNIAQIEQWARDYKVDDEKRQVIEALAPVIQATQLLQTRKTQEDAVNLCNMCDQLRVSQIIKILNLYTPADEYEERVTPAFVRKIQSTLQERSNIESQKKVFITVTIIINI